MKLDLFDKKIIYELEKDSSQPVSKIAKKLNRSKEFINFRIKRLEKEEIILGYSAIVDMSKLGYFTFRIYIKWQNMTLETKQEFYNYIKVLNNVWTTTVMHGRWDFAFFVGVKASNHINSFHKLWEEIQSKYKEKISESKIAIYAPIYNFNKKFFMEEQKETIERIYGNGEIVEFDELDEKIINAFSGDISRPLVEIAKQIKMNPETLRQRINLLEKKEVIVGYKINLNLNKMGFQGYRVDFSLNSISRNKELFDYLKFHKYFYQINKSIGGADFEAEIVVRDLNHLLEILEDVMEKFNEIIKGYDYMGYSEFPTLSIVPD